MVSNYLGLEDGKVNQSYGDIYLGVGIRSLKGDQIGYGFTQELTAEPMMPAAATASTLCDMKATPVVHSFNPPNTDNYYQVALDYSGIPAKSKLPVVKSINVEDKGVAGNKWTESVGSALVTLQDDPFFIVKAGIR